MKLKLICLFSTLIVCLTTSFVKAASFDCSKASTKVEHLICDDPALSKLDEEMASAYKNIDKSIKYFPVLKTSHQSWLKDRSKALDVASLASFMSDHIQFLTYSASAFNCIEQKGLVDECIGSVSDEFEPCWEKKGWSDRGGASCYYKQADLWDIVGTTERQQFFKAVKLSDAMDGQKEYQSNNFKESDDFWRKWARAHCQWIQSEGGTMDDLISASCVADQYVARAKLFFQMNADRR